MRVARAGRPGGWGVRDARLPGGGGRFDGRQPGLWGERSRGTCEPDASAEGCHPGGGVLAVSVVWGLPGVGPTPVPSGAAVLVYRATGVAPRGPRAVGPARGLRPVRLPAGRCPAAEPGGWTAGHKRAGAHPAPEGGAPGCRADSPRRGRLWPTGRSRVWLRPTYRNSRLGPPGLIAARTHNRAALAAAGRGRRVHPATPNDQGGPARSRADKCALQPHRSCSTAHRCSPPTRAPATAQGSPTRLCRPG